MDQPPMELPGRMGARLESVVRIEEREARLAEDEVRGRNIVVVVGGGGAEVNPGYSRADWRDDDSWNNWLSQRAMIAWLAGLRS